MRDGELRCDLLVFDLDGTLVDSQQDLVHSVNATLSSLHRHALESRLVASFIGDGASMLVRRALEATGGVDEPLMARAMPAFLSLYRVHMLDTTAAYPGAREALEQIRKTLPSLPMAVLTNKPESPSRAICDALGLSAFFFQNYGGNSFATKKPDPLGMNALVQEASALTVQMVRRQRTVLIGDSHVDVETARAAGVRCVGCTYGLDEERLRASAPDVLVDSPMEWIAALQRMLD